MTITGHQVGAMFAAIAAIAAAPDGVCATDTAGDTWCWGGSGSSAGDIPVAVPAPTEPDLSEVEEVLGGHTFTTITDNDSQACALDTAGKAWCWGEPLSPIAVPGGHSFTSMTADGEDMCALDTAGKAWCWEDGYIATPGAGDAIVKTTQVPVAVPGQLRFSRIGGHCALDTAGKAWCWGDGTEGELGQGDPQVTETDKPVAVVGGHTFTTIIPSPIGDYECALDTAGKAWCWGADESGQLADGDPIGADKFMPVPVAGGHTFTKLAAVGEPLCGLDREGRATCEPWFDQTEQ